ncbi:conserved hypothetical protein [Methylobacterium sp. 4-46]|uniref:hypothetical protein n=1 Tax=unclassified Methylobacterium TaxID=2615210 RepID=UPI000152C3D9|nr:MULTISPECIES: hypothetical protein [Methylobacterium]ACA17027.1 conserved hypothetical protein [Methylobacterium sp. 4-46]WFT82716.1 hypothetical protein QA634_13125 [Methylobacterium nodulans]
MRLRVSLALVLLSAGAAGATELRPGHAHNLDLGPYRGVAYYTVERDGYRVVATLASAERPVRLVATLAPDQRVSLSVPGQRDEAPAEIAFARRGDRVEVMAPGF